MLGDAYFQLRAQVGTGLFSLLRLAAEAGAEESTQAGLRGAQAGLRDSFTFAALGPEGGGKSTLLNSLFERDFCGSAEPATQGRVAVFQFGDEVHDETPSPEIIECRRPHIFLRDFTLIEAPATASAETVAPLLARCELIFYVLSAATSAGEFWPSLSRLGREVLKRLVFVVWQSDRVSAEEGASAVKRLRQAMLKNLGQACPIFLASTATSDRAGREKLQRWIENEIIFSEPRRARLREIDGLARDALREIVEKPRAERQTLERQRELVRRLRASLTEREEQSERQIAGALWTLAQSSDALRRRGEELLREHLGPFDLLWKRAFRPQEFAREIEVQARAALEVQLHDQLEALEVDLKAGAREHARESRTVLPETEVPGTPKFPREELEETLKKLGPPLEVAPAVLGAFTGGVRILQLPLFAALAALAVAAGAMIAGHGSQNLTVLAAAVVLFVLLLAVLLRRNVIAAFGAHLTANRAALLAVLEPPLREAIVKFYATLVPALEARAGQLAGDGERHAPLLARLQQIEETFSRIEVGLRVGTAPPEAATIPGPDTPAGR